jgi:hypothetical protein
VSDYHKLPIAQKRAEALARAREPAVTCPQCDVQVMTADLINHREQRCPGQREPGPGARWVGWREAVAIIRRAMQELSEAAAMMRLSRWSHANHRGVVLIRVTGTRGDRKYLHADLVKYLARPGVIVGTNRNVSEPLP